MTPLKRLRVDCCGKRRYATREAAEQTLDHITAVSNRDQIPVRAYQCPRGWWHLTSSSETDYRARIYQEKQA